MGRLTVHRAFQGRQAVDLAFGLTIAPLYFDPMPDRIDVPVYGAGKRSVGASSVSIASSIQAGSGSALRPRIMPLKRMAKCRIVVKAGEPSLRASTFLACSKVSGPLGLMQRSAAMTGDIACPVSGSWAGSMIWYSLMGRPCSCFSALRHPAKSRCRFDKLLS